MGNYTCYNKNGGCSTIDYALVSYPLFSHINDFRIDTFDKCLSDVHCPIMMTLQSSRLQAHSAITSSGSEVESVHVEDEGESMPAMSFDWSNDVMLIQLVLFLVIWNVLQKMLTNRNLTIFT